jgi:hypothetical protein
MNDWDEYDECGKEEEQVRESEDKCKNASEDNSGMAKETGDDDSESTCIENGEDGEAMETEEHPHKQRQMASEYKGDKETVPAKVSTDPFEFDQPHENSMLNPVICMVNMCMPTLELF